MTDDTQFPAYVAEPLSRLPGDVEHHLAEAREGRFRVERLLYHVAGVPTYIMVAELAVHVVLHGQTAEPDSLVAALDAASDLIGETAG